MIPKLKEAPNQERIALGRFGVGRIPCRETRPALALLLLDSKRLHHDQRNTKTAQGKLRRNPGAGTWQWSGKS
jgi:hypothetical protein